MEPERVTDAVIGDLRTSRGQITQGHRPAFVHAYDQVRILEPGLAPRPLKGDYCRTPWLVAGMYSGSLKCKPQDRVGNLRPCVGDGHAKVVGCTDVLLSQQ